MDSIEERTNSKWDLFGNKKMVLPFNWRYDPRSRVVRKAIKTVRSVLVDKQKWAQDHSQCLSFTFGQMVVVQNTYRSTLVGCKVRDIESTRFGPKKLDIDAALARKSCATKPNHRCQPFTRNRSTVSTISGRANRREIFVYSTSNGSFILQPRPEQSNAQV